MASCVKNIFTKNYQNLISLIGFQVTVKNVGDVFFETQCKISKLQFPHLYAFTLIINRQLAIVAITLKMYKTLVYTLVNGNTYKR